MNHSSPWATFAQDLISLALFMLGMSALYIVASYAIHGHGPW